MPLSEETWKKIEDKQVLKRKLQEARTRHQRKDASAKYQEACRDVKRLCRRDKRNYTNNLAAEGETAARQRDLKTLYSISKKLNGRLQNKDRPVRNKEGKLLKNIDEDLKRWKEHFEKCLTAQTRKISQTSHQGQTYPFTWVASQKRRSVRQ